MELDGLYDAERVALFERAYKRSMEDGLDLGSSSSKDKSKASDIIFLEYQNMIKSIDANVMGKDVNAMLRDDSLAVFNDKAPSTGFDVDGQQSGEIIVDNGIKYRVTRNENGRIVHRSIVE